MTQPHYIDREGVELTSASEVWDFLASDGPLSRWIKASTLTESERINLGYAVVADRKDQRHAPMEAVAWRYPVLTARDEAVARMARAMRNGKAWAAVFQANTAEALAEDALAALEALAVIPTEGGGDT